MQLERIDHVQLVMPAGQEELAREFYSELPGLAEVPKPPKLAASGGAWFENEHVHVHLGVDPEFSPAKKAHPAFRVHNLSAWKQRLGDADVELVEDDRLPGFTRFFTHDPFGNRLEFPQAL